MADRDLAILEAFRVFLGRGSIHWRDRQREHWQPQATFTINSRRAHREVTIPFADRYLLPGAKRRQFEAWRAAFVEHEKQHPPKVGRSICRIDGCDRYVRGRGLCRSHYYRETGY